MRVCLIIILLFNVFTSCNYRKRSVKKEDYFYLDDGGLDLKRIPLIKPYEAKNVLPGEWRIELQTPQLLELSIHHVKEISVIDSVILVHAKGEVSLGGHNCKEAWFVLLPGVSKEKGFLKEKDFLSFLSERNIKLPQLREVNSVYDQFKRDKKIVWQTGKF
ncbi:hypothetical protein [Niastella sp. OAS944]|uniref:hypothetical protein n=1 Tax=Niastella sp. OAS944 TaxID=2664089 RepID=UPI0034793359|nr:hypothetical protein [Chitinophagaceae bacterium OAS944]